MKTSLFIAFRYLFGRNFVNIINLITGISVLVIAFVTASMIIVLSAFNGIESLVDQVYSSFDSDIAIVPIKGKTLDLDSLNFKTLEFDEAVSNLEYTIQENVLLAYFDKQRIATLKGVTNSFLVNSGLSQNVIFGSSKVVEDSTDFAIIGYGVRSELAADLYSESFEPLTIFAPERGKNLRKYKENTFNQAEIMIGGIYSINAEFDSKYVLVPFNFAKDVFEYKNEISTVEINLMKGVDTKTFIANHIGLLRNNQKFLTREDKNKLVYQASNSERIATIFILSFIIIIGAFNMLASLTIVIIDKAKDITILNSMGADEKSILNIFFFQGMLIALIGLVLGLVIGLILCLIQQKFGIIPLDGGIVPYYPVVLDSNDFILTSAIVIIMAFLFTWFPVKYLSRVHVFSKSNAFN